MEQRSGPLRHWRRRQSHEGQVQRLSDRFGAIQSEFFPRTSQCAAELARCRKYTRGRDRYRRDGAYERFASVCSRALYARHSGHPASNRRSICNRNPHQRGGRRRAGAQRYIRGRSPANQYVPNSEGSRRTSTLSLGHRPLTVHRRPLSRVAVGDASNVAGARQQDRGHSILQPV